MDTFSLQNKLKNTKGRKEGVRRATWKPSRFFAAFFFFFWLLKDGYIYTVNTVLYSDFVIFFTFLVKSEDFSLSFIMIIIKNNLNTFIRRKTVVAMHIVKEEREKKKKIACASPHWCSHFQGHYSGPSLSSSSLCICVL